MSQNFKAQPAGIAPDWTIHNGRLSYSSQHHPWTSLHT